MPAAAARRMVEWMDILQRAHESTGKYERIENPFRFNSSTDKKNDPFEFNWIGRSHKTDLHD
jgi:hypothetical protein